MAELAPSLLGPSPNSLPAQTHTGNPGWYFSWVLTMAVLSLGTAALLCSILLQTWLPGLSAHWPLPAQRWLAALQPEPNWHQQLTGTWLQGVQERGVLLAAVRYYPRPAPLHAPMPPEPDGMDHALARFIALRLGVRLELVASAGTTPSAQHAGKDRPDLHINSHDLLLHKPTSTTASNWPIPSAYQGGTGRLSVLRSSALARLHDLKKTTVCLQQGSPYASLLAQRWQAIPRFYPSGIHAISGFMAGECQALAEDEVVLARLHPREDWRFYRQLPQALLPDREQEEIILHRGDPASAALIERMIRYWRSGGPLLEARQQRGADLAFEMSQLDDGLICHS